MKVLVVDDDGISRMVLQHLLGSMGLFDIEEADDGQIAWELLQQGLQPAICFCDGRMPRMSGLALLDKMQADSRLKKIPFVLVSANEEEETLHQALTMGAAGYIVKPFEMAQVRAQLDKHVRAQWRNLIEVPQQSLQRLKINAQQLQGYLLAFAHQIKHLESELQNNTITPQSLPQRLENVGHACLTLGLNEAAEQIGKLGNLAPERQLLLIRNVKNSVAYQLAQVRAILPQTNTIANPPASEMPNFKPSP